MLEILLKKESSDFLTKILSNKLNKKINKINHGHYLVLINENIIQGLFQLENNNIINFWFENTVNLIILKNLLNSKNYKINI